MARTRYRPWSANQPDLIILDLGLPDIDGVDVTRRLREWTQIPIIIVSVQGTGSGEDQGAGCRRGRLPDQTIRRG